MCKVVTKFFEIVLVQHLPVPLIWAPRHTGEFYNLLLLFAIESMIHGGFGVPPEKAALDVGE